MADIDKKPGFKVSEGDWTCEEQGYVTYKVSHDMSWVVKWGVLTLLLSPK